jgi:hypothetical protein
MQMKMGMEIPGRSGRWSVLRSSPGRRLRLWLGLLACGPGLAFATCDTVAFSSSGVDMGRKGYTSLPRADIAGYKLVGARGVTLRAVCDDTPDTRQIRVDALVADDTPGLVRWSSTAARAGDIGAARMVVQQATAGGHEVPMTFTPVGGTTSTITPGPLTLAGAGMLVLDLRAVPRDTDARKNVLVNLQIQTMVKSSGFAPSAETPFRLDLGMTVP